MIGNIECSGIGAAVACDVAKPMELLWATHMQSNKSLVEGLREDVHADWLLEHTQEEARLGRMSAPVVLWPGQGLQGWILQPRFAVSKTRNDGSVKNRAVDHFSWSEGDGKAGSVNGFTTPGILSFAWPSPRRVPCVCVCVGVCLSPLPGEKLKHDTLDEFAVVLRRIVNASGSLPWLYKSDIDAAFRRVPVKAEHRDLCAVAFRKGNKVPFLRRLWLTCVCLFAWVGRCTPHSTTLVHSAQWARSTVGSV